MDATLTREFGLEFSGSISDEEILSALQTRIETLLRTDPMRLLQILYCIDVDERAVEAAIDDANPAEKLACLILQRSRLKATTRAAFRPPPVHPDDTDLMM